MPHDHDAIENLEANGRHDEDVHGGAVWCVVAEESLPGLRRPSPTPGHVLGDRRLSDFDPELEQFAMDTRRAPQPIGQAHFPDQAADLAGYPRPPAMRARLPAPVQSEPLPMTPDDGDRLDNRDFA